MRRLRRYTAGIWLPRCTGLGLTKSDFERMFYRHSVASPVVYFKADPVMVSNTVSEDAELIASQVDRLEGRTLQACRTGLCSSDLRTWTVPCALADLRQSETWGRIDVAIMPALLRKSLIYEMVSGRLVGEVALWLAQGFPHPLTLGLSDSGSAACLKFSFGCCHLAPQSTQPSSGTCGTGSQGSGVNQVCDVSQANPLLAVSVGDRRAMAGNAMNITQVSAFLAFVFSSLSEVRDTSGYSSGSPDVQ